MAKNNIGGEGKEIVSVTDRGLTWDDLVLVLESYKNMIALNSTLLEKQQKMIELEEKLEILAEYKKKEIDDTKRKVEFNIEQLNKIIGFEATVIDKIDEFRDLYITKGNERDLKANTALGQLLQDHIKLASKVNLIYVALGSIIISLIGLVLAVLHSGA